MGVAVVGRWAVRLNAASTIAVRCWRLPRLSTEHQCDAVPPGFRVASFLLVTGVSAGLGVSILPEVAILPEHAVLDARDGFPPITDTAVALVAAPDASAASRRLAEALAKFCSTLNRRMAA